MTESTIPDSTLLALMCEGSDHPREDLRLALAQDTIERAPVGALGRGEVSRILTRPPKDAAKTREYDTSRESVRVRSGKLHRFLSGGAAE